MLDLPQKVQTGDGRGKYNLLNSYNSQGIILSTLHWLLKYCLLLELFAVYMNVIDWGNISRKEVETTNW